MSLTTQLQPALAVSTVIASPASPTASAVVLGTLGTALSGQLESSVSLINTGLMGPPGPPGPPGPTGPGEEYHRHDQGTPADLWTVNHNFGQRPVVGVFDTGGREVWAEVIHFSDNQVLIYFDGPLAGYAICT